MSLEPRRASAFAYVGSRTTRERNSRGEGITVFRVDPQAGHLTPVQVLGGLVNPSFLALNAHGNRLYTVHGDGHAVSVLSVDRNDGMLALMQQRDCGGHNPVHLALDPTERHLLVANHLSHTVAVMPIADDGTLEQVSQTVELKGPTGPHRIEQPFAKPHHCVFDPSGRFVVVPDKGLNRVFVFRFEAGRLTPAATPFVSTRETAGPRHVAFHPRSSWAYVVNELDSTVTGYRFDAQDGTLEPFQTLPTLADTVSSDSRAAEIEIDATGSTLYVSNRGDDSIAAFRIEAESGRLRFLEAVSAQGRTPRHFALGPDRRVLFVLNEDSDAITPFAVDATNASLAAIGSPVPCGSPVCIVFSP